MREKGVRFMGPITPEKMWKSGDKISVQFNAEVPGRPGVVEEFDTVLYATGRTADTKALNLSAAGVESLANGKIDTASHRAALTASADKAPPNSNMEQTNVPHIFAVGDVLDKCPELTPVAIHAGELLAERLFGTSTEKMDYDLVPTTVFTPAEYGAVGLSEEEAIERYGADDIEVFLSEFDNLEATASHPPKAKQCQADEYDVQMSPSCFSKVVCQKSKKMKILGLHFIGPSAGEVLQGFALALRLGATKADLDKTIGIHPTAAESLVGLEITKASGVSFRAAGGCGGGKCG
eukprot:Selendium_serpulae@DN4850_c0_g1_i2.p1